ncbi:MAG: 5,10-methylenetetrahydrofolate reductase [Deltaproteobacteria bacterium]|jgi:methylenetetrahydrofolate reductase (NADPH)|nr:5,10-methylenetetrahydrofolate reductase [Deltaproteobacteria bacterium]
MPQHSIELVPRSEDALAEEIQSVRAHFPDIQTVNIPDLARFPLRSWEACGLARRSLPRAIPHLAAETIDLSGRGGAGRLGLSELKGCLAEHDLREVLVVQGDASGREGRAGTTTLELIGALRAAAPDLRIYAALDPYRSSPQRELAYAREKRAAGADGFFTQPFFDLRYQEIWAELLEGELVYWGVTPVLANSTRRYWERRNAAFLPHDFEPTLAWNRAYARRVLAWAERSGAHLYFMPIRADLAKLLGGIL